VSGGILSGPEILWEVNHGDIQIDPFEPGNLNPASIDLRLGSTALAISNAEFLMDVKIAQPDDDYLRIEIGPTGIILSPDYFYLMHTLEHIGTLKYVPVLDGKSSIGRLGVSVHETAGYGDPGFRGQYTLEVRCFRPTKLYAGMRICQMRFHTLVGTPRDYAQIGNYRGVFAEGPVISQVHMQFEEKKK